MTARRTEGDLWRLFWGALVTRLLAIAADLGVADALADGPRPVDELAREVGADPDAVHHILPALGELTAAGEPTFEPIHGTDFWSWLGERPDERAAFDRALSGSWEWKVDRVASAEWRGDELVVDVGGGARERDEAQWRALLEGNGFELLGVEDGLVEARCR